MMVSTPLSPLLPMMLEDGGERSTDREDAWRKEGRGWYTERQDGKKNFKNNFSYTWVPRIVCVEER